MSGLRNALEYFVAPRSPADGERQPRSSAQAALDPPAAGVLGAPDDVAPVAALLSAELRLRFRASCVLLADYNGVEPSEDRAGLASRPAKQLAGRLAGRDLDVRAHGRSVTARLPVDPHAAGLAWQRARAAAHCPSVCALSGPRPEGLDPLIGELDLIVLVLGAVASRELGQLAVAGLAGTRALVVSSRPVPGGVVRMLASSSIATSRLLGTDVTQAVRALG